MNYQNILIICEQIRKDIINSFEYREYKKYEAICLKKHLSIFEEYHNKQDIYLSLKTDKTKKEYIKIKEELFKIEAVVNYFKYKQKTEEMIGNINFEISKCFPIEIKYKNEIGTIGGKNCG